MRSDELSRRLIEAEPTSIAGRFSTVFRDGTTGESGRFLFVDPGRWVVWIDGAATLWSDGVGRHTRDRTGKSSGSGTTMPRRPPWSMVVPRLAGVHGRPDDEWGITEVDDIGQDRVRAVLRADGHEAHMVVDLAQLVIVELVTPSWEARVELGLPSRDVASLQAMAGLDEDGSDPAPPAASV